MARYQDYRRYLRRDFWYSCAYCTTTEAEAQALRFTIDHYEPVGSRPDLENDYSNLMYCCDECNLRKGNRCPPAEAREKGFRFFRPDSDVRNNHFQEAGVRVESRTPTGEYTLHALDLNRAALRRIRDLRERLTSNQQFVFEGITGLRHLKIDRLPPEVRGRAHTLRTQLEKTAEALEGDIDAILTRYAQSQISDLEEDEAAQKERREKLAGIHALFPAAWRAPRGQ